MPSIYDLKPKFQNLLRPLTNNLASKGITANQVTLFAMLISIATGALLYSLSFWQWPFLLIPVVLFVRMALNAIDGMLAREHNMKSSLGAILNELGDVISDAALYLPIAMIAGVEPVWVVLVVLFAVISEMTGVIAIQIGATRRYDGPMGKSDRAFVFAVIGLLLGIGIEASSWLNYVMIGVLVLLFVTIYNRASRALKEIQQ